MISPLTLLLNQENLAHEGEKVSVLGVLTMMRRLSRLTNAFSKKWENLQAALALHFAYYNFCRIHKSLRCTPAMEAGITGHVWELRELLI
jgi:hypothetical protein